MAEENMSRNEAIAYLKRKGKQPTEENINKVIQEGKIYGDPIASVKW